VPLTQDVRPSDPQVVPRLLRLALYTGLITAGLASFASIGRPGLVPATTLLDAWIVAYMSACLVRGRIRTTAPLVLLTAYFLTRITPALLNDTPLPDFLQAYRWVLYLAALLLAVGRTWGGDTPLRKFAFILIGLALVKAIVTLAALGPGERPGLLIENNFEIALFAGLACIIYPRLTSRDRLMIVGMLGLLMVLSGSRSGAIAYAVLVAFAITQLPTTRATKSVLTIYALPFVALVPVLIFVERARSSTMRIDRLNFLDTFIRETSSWSPLQWLVGTEPLTPLTSDSCGSLAYYQTLFSSAGDGSCYSVILHAFAMRVVFDAGIIGLVLAFGLAWYAMRKGGVATPVALCLLGIAASNSLSVSGLNNPYVILPILAAILISPATYGRESDDDSAPTRRRSSVQAAEIQA